MTERTQQNLFGDDVLPADAAPWELAAGEDLVAAEIVFNRPLDTRFHYLVPDDLREMITPGQRVKAPFGRGDRLTVGFCVEVGPVPETKRKLKAVDSIIDREPLVSPELLSLTKWIAERYLCPWGQVLHGVIPAGVKKRSGTRMIRHFRAAPGATKALDGDDLPPKQRAVLEVLCAGTQPMSVGEITEIVDCGTSPINGLREKGLIQAIQQRTDNYSPEGAAVESVDDLTLNRDQQQAMHVLRELLEAGEHETVLLHGVTGSGKTEVYIQAIREVVGFGRQAIVLVPEISLTPQTIRRFRSRFDSVAVLHSHLTDAERHWHWQQIARGAVQVVVGARSAVFAPTPNPGLIVIDEEHETSFKQDSAPRYHTREVARRRAIEGRFPLILGSATPTLESWRRVNQNKDVLISMPRRVEDRPLPPVVVVDVRNDPYIAKGAAIGRQLESSMRIALGEGGQVILFLNLRGFSPILWCTRCEECIKCPHCDITLTWHRDKRAALCHFCEFEIRNIRQCPVCTCPSIRYLGTGTQRLETEVRAKFSDFPAVRMDSDSMKARGSHDVALDAFHEGTTRILLGTQMIAKGLDFPNVTLVGVVDADTILHQPDLRAAERTFQLIAQVAGRTGRSARGGRVLVQTCSPGEPAITTAARHDYPAFVAQEMEHRREMNSPPFVHLARVILRGVDENAVRAQSREMARVLKTAAKDEELPVRILGPAPAPIAKLKANHRFHLQLSAEKVESIHDLWRAAEPKLPASSNVEHVIDVDPVNMR